jgi:serine/threonine protein kinase/tetratricopeptide (TPR) repeat protein
LALKAGTRLGAYEILDLLGSGGMGEVYRASDSRLGREVAIKVLRPDLLAKATSRLRFEREAKALSRLSHPGIATIFDVGVDQGMDFLVMEFVRGVNLATVIKQGPLPESETMAIARQVAEALADAHAAGVVHRDLKPANVVKTPKGSIKILDFGIAQFTGPADGAPNVDAMTQTGDVLGTLPYMPPEQLRGAAPDARMDVYALGLLMYELVTGTHPFASQAGIDLVQAILEDEPPAPSTRAPQLSPAFERVILRCLEKQMADRWQSASDVVAALHEAESGRGPKRSRAGTRSPSRSPLRARDVTSLVALPARVFAPDQDAFLADATSSALTTQLSGTKGLDVRLSPSSADVERAGGDLAKIANAYGVVACLLSSITLRQDEMTLNVQLAEPRTKRVLWSGEYHGPAAKYAGLVRKASDEIRLALRPVPRPARTASTATAPVTIPANVELMFQRGRFHLNAFVNRGLRADLTAALSAFDHCLQTDPGRADAAAGIAEAYMAALIAGDSLAEIGPLVTGAVDRALTIDPRSSRAWAVKSEVEPARTPASYRLKLEYALRSATFGPQDAYAHSRLAGPLTAASYELASAASAQASRLDPLVLRTAVYEALALSILGRSAEGLERADYALRIEPDQPFALLARALALVMCDEEDDAFSVLTRLKDLAASRRVQPAWVSYAADLAIFARASKARDAATADACADRLIRAARGETPFPYWQNTTQSVTPMLTRHGRTEEALDLLQFRARGDILEALDVLLFNSDFLPLRRSPRFTEVVDAADRRFRTMMAILEAARGRGELPAYLEPPIGDLLDRLAVSAS